MRQNNTKKKIVKKVPDSTYKKKIPMKKIPMGNTNEDEDIDETFYVDEEVVADSSSSSILHALKLQSEEQTNAIERLERENSDDKGIEARIEARLKVKLMKELKESEDRQDIFFRAASQQFESSFNGNFKSRGDQRFYDHLQEVETVLEEHFHYLHADLPDNSKAWISLKKLVSKITNMKEDVVTAQVSRHGWDTVDRYNGEETGYKFITDPIKAKSLTQIEKELDDDIEDVQSPNDRYRSRSKSSDRQSHSGRYRTRSKSPEHGRSWSGTSVGLSEDFEDGNARYEDVGSSYEEK